MNNICYLNGEYLHLEDAKISALDRGFIFGEGVYEVILVSGGRAFALSEHLERLDSSLHDLGIANPLKKNDWNRVIENIVSLNNGGELVIYVQITRGASPRRHEFPTDNHPTIFMMANPSDYEESLQKVKAVTADDNRWKRCHIKTTSLYANTRLRNFAKKKGAQECILKSDGFVTEGASSNIFVVSDDNCIRTPPLSSNILPGVTRSIICDLASNMDLVVLEEEISEQSLKAAKELWLTNTTNGIRCVFELDEKIIGNGTNYPVATMMHDSLSLEKKR